MQWLIPFNELSERQRGALSEITQEPQRAHWIRGCAGTGKTLVMVLLIERLASIDPTGSMCFITYTNALVDLAKTGIDASLTARVKVMTHTKFLKEGRAYKYVFLDEVQDIPPEDLRKIRAQAQRLFFAGDPDQRIYANRSSDSDIRALVTGKEIVRQEVYRLTPEVRALAEELMPETSLVEAESAKDGESFLPQIHELDSEAEEAAWVWETALACASPEKPSVVLLPSHEDIHRFASHVAQHLGAPIPPKPKWQRNRHHDYKPFNTFLDQHEIPLSYIGGGHGSLCASDDEALVYLMTYHSSKGLDFETVFLPGLNDTCDLVRASLAEADPELEARLLFVAVTRSRRRLFISHITADPHSMLACIDPDILAPFEPDAWSELLANESDDDLSWDAELEDDDE